jgi:predicted nucleic acid-binding protein
VRFWDSSALVALHVDQGAATKAVRALYTEDPEVLAWVLSDVEIASALRRLGREGLMSAQDLEEALRRFDGLWGALHAVSLTAPVKARAKRLLAAHPLHAADALQLGAALVAARDEPAGWELVCLDQRLEDAARREGFSVLPR